MTELQQFYIDHGICYKCGQEKAERGKHFCWRCLVATRERQRAEYAAMSPEKREELSQKRREYYKLSHEKRKAAGLCVRCGKPNHDSRFLHCDACRARARNKRLIRVHENGVLPRQMRGDGHRCYICTREVPLVPGKKLCPECYEKVCKSLEKGRKCRSELAWRTTNELFFKKNRKDNKDEN